MYSGTTAWKPRYRGPYSRPKSSPRHFKLYCKAKVGTASVHRCCCREGIIKQHAFLHCPNLLRSRSRGVCIQSGVCCRFSRTFSVLQRHCPPRALLAPAVPISCARIGHTAGVDHDYTRVALGKNKLTVHQPPRTNETQTSIRTFRSISPPAETVTFRSPAEFAGYVEVYAPRKRFGPTTCNARRCV